MSVTRLLDAAESHEISGRVNVASSLATALRAARSDPITEKLAAEVKSSKGVALRVLMRALKLTRQTVDIRYENPNDVALFIYLLVLQEHSQAFALIAAAAVCHVPNLWWSSVLAASLLEGTAQSNQASGDVSLALTETAHDAVDRIFVADTRVIVTEGLYQGLFDLANQASEAGVVNTGNGTSWQEVAEGTRDPETAIR